MRGKKNLQASQCRILGQIQTWVRVLEPGHLTCCLSQTEGAFWGTGSFVPMNGSSWATRASGRLFSQVGPRWTCGVSSLSHHHHLSSGSLKSHWGLTPKKRPFSCSFSKSALTTEHKSFSSLQTERQEKRWRRNEMLRWVSQREANFHHPVDLSLPPASHREIPGH